MGIVILAAFAGAIQQPVQVEGRLGPTPTGWAAASADPLLVLDGIPVEGSGNLLRAVLIEHCGIIAERQRR